MNRLSRFVFAALAAMVAGCASQPPAPAADSPVRTYDGLYPVENVSVTGVWAPELTRAAVFDALRNRRVFATTNTRTLVRFRVAGEPMGSVLSGYGRVPIEAHVSARRDENRRIPPRRSSRPEG